MRLTQDVLLIVCFYLRWSLSINDELKYFFQRPFSKALIAMAHKKNKVIKFDRSDPNLEVTFLHILKLCDYQYFPENLDLIEVINKLAHRKGFLSILKKIPREFINVKKLINAGNIQPFITLDLSVHQQDLLHAIRHSKIEIVEYFTRNGEDVNAFLQEAIKINDQEIIDVLIPRATYESNSFCINILQSCICNDDDHTLEKLFAKMPTDMYNRYLNDLLHTVIVSKLHKCFQFLISFSPQPINHVMLKEFIKIAMTFGNQEAIVYFFGLVPELVMFLFAKKIKTCSCQQQQQRTPLCPTCSITINHFFTEIILKYNNRYDG